MSVLGSLAIVIEIVGDGLICVGVGYLIGAKRPIVGFVVVLLWMIFALAHWGPSAFSW